MAAFAIGIILWIGHVLVLSIGLAPVTYALVIDNTCPTEGIEKGWRFFLDHKPDVVLMCLVMVVIFMLLGMIRQIFFIHPVTTVIWQFVSMLINVCTIMLLITVWWTRLYLIRVILVAGTVSWMRSHTTS